MAEPVSRLDEFASPEPRVDVSPQPRLVPPPPRTALPSAQERHPRLTRTAGVVGSAVGTAMDKVRQLPRRVSDMKERFTVIRGRARDDASVAAGEWKDAARHRAHQVRSRARYYADEYPVQSILGIAGAAFVLGAVLRIWRSTRD